MDRRSLRFCLLAGLLFPTGPLMAQPAPKPDPSPLAPGNLKAPIFDTTTPVYPTSDAMEKSAHTVVAEVDGRPIMLQEVADAIAELPQTARNLAFADLYPQVLDRLVRQQALVIEAQREGLDADPAIKLKMKAVADRVLGDELVKRQAAKGITEAALLDRYNKEFANKPGPEQAHVRVIMVPTEQAALGAIANLKSGEDFAAVAKRVSQDPTALNGGDAGYVTLDQLTPEIGAVVFSLPPGQYTQLPVHTQGQWYVLKVDDRRAGPPPPFGTVRDALRDEMIKDRAGDVIKAALAGVTVREYNINGKEPDKVDALPQKGG